MILRTPHKKILARLSFLEARARRRQEDARKRTDMNYWMGYAHGLACAARVIGGEK